MMIQIPRTDNYVRPGLDPEDLGMRIPWLLPSDAPPLKKMKRKTNQSMQVAACGPKHHFNVVPGATILRVHMTRCRRYASHLCGVNEGGQRSCTENTCHLHAAEYVSTRGSISRNARAPSLPSTNAACSRVPGHLHGLGSVSSNPHKIGPQKTISDSRKGGSEAGVCVSELYISTAELVDLVDH